MLKIGDKAPPFKLLNQNDEEVSLGDLVGKWVVLYFYPKDDTPGCTVEACTFTDNLSQFRGLDCEVIGVSADSTESHRKFIEKKNLKITLLSDINREVLKQYEAWGEKSMYGKIFLGIVRSTFLIDPKGNIAYIWKNVKAAGHAEKVQEKVKELRG